MLTGFSEVLSQTQHDPEHQEGEEHALSGVEDDGHPHAPVAVGGEGVQEAGEDRIRYPPGLVDVVKTEEHADNWAVGDEPFVVVDVTLEDQGPR
jgi:hypothetical protein